MANENIAKRPQGEQPQRQDQQVEQGETRTIAWYRPAVDVYEGKDSLVLYLDVPGVKCDGFDVNLEGRILTVQGVRTTGRSGWRRAFNLPDGFDAEKIEAKCENGVLELTLPKSEQHRPRRIEVK